MTEYFYDRIDNCILKTSNIESFYKDYWSNDYVSFEEYLDYNYPNLIWLENYNATDTTKKYFDFDHDEIVTIEDLKKWYDRMTNEEKQEYNNSFSDYVSCCMYYNNGCLKKINK